MDFYFLYRQDNLKKYNYIKNSTFIYSSNKYSTCTYGTFNKYVWNFFATVHLIKKSLIETINSNSISITDSTSIEFMSRGVSDVYYYCLPYFYGMTHVSKVGSVFTTLAVSLERYFAVCRPLWIRIRRCHPSFYIILVNVFAFAFNIPKFLEFEVSY